MDNIMIVDRVSELKARFLTEVCPKARDQYEAKSFSSIISHLQKIEHECRTGNLTVKRERYGYVARLVAESDPSLLSPDLGGQLIEVEQAYRNL
ncbi:MAG: hypothetical protein ABW077_14115 [Candidatus Thiodiazotropha endolucinida]